MKHRLGYLTTLFVSAFPLAAQEGIAAKSAASPEFVRANAWLAMPVQRWNADGEKQDMGRITGLILHRESGRIELAAVHLARPLDDRDAMVLEVPMEKLKLDAERGSFLCTLTPIQLSELSAYDPSRYRIGTPPDEREAAEAKASKAAANPPSHVLIQEIDGLSTHGKGGVLLGRISRLDLETGSATVAFGELQAEDGTHYLVPWRGLRIDDQGGKPRLHVDLAADDLPQAPMVDEQVLADSEKRREVYEFFRVPLPEYERKNAEDGAGQ